MRKVVYADGVSENANLVSWLDEARVTYCSLDFKPPGDDRLRGTIESVPVGRLTVSRVHCNADTIWHTPARSDGNDDHFVALVLLEGEGEIRQQQRTGRMRPGDMVIHDCAEPYQLRFPHGPHSLFGVRIPRDRLMGTISSAPDLTARVVPRAQLAPQILRHTLDTLHRNAAAVPGRPESALSDVVVDAVVAGLHCLSDVPAKGLAAYHVARIYDHIRRHLADPDLSVVTVAGAVGLSVDHVSRLFRKQPRSVPEWIWQERLEACRRSLLDPRLSVNTIGEIAYSWGFKDAAHFSRRFRLAYGCSPRDYRRKHVA